MMWWIINNAHWILLQWILVANPCCGHQYTPYRGGYLSIQRWVGVHTEVGMCPYRGGYWCNPTPKEKQYSHSTRHQAIHTDSSHKHNNQNNHTDSSHKHIIIPYACHAITTYYIGCSSSGCVWVQPVYQIHMLLCG